MKNKLIIGIIVGLVILLGAGAVLAWNGDSFSWSRVEDKVAEILAGKVDAPEGGIGAATIERTGSSARQASGSLDSTTSTFAYWYNNTGRVVVIDKIDLALDAYSQTGPAKSGQQIVMVTSTKSFATSTGGNDPFLKWQLTTSTAPQLISTGGFSSSTFGNEGTDAWKRLVSNGEYVLFGFAGYMGASTTPPLWNTASSTGSFKIDYFLK